MNLITEIDIIVTMDTKYGTDEIFDENETFHVEIEEKDLIEDLFYDDWVEITSGFKSKVYYQFGDGFLTLYVSSDKADWLKTYVTSIG